MYNLETLNSENPQHQEVILYYKTMPCPSLQQEGDLGNQSPKKMCTQLHCFYYHSSQEMRRQVFDEQENGLTYEPAFCPSLQGGFQCMEGNGCGYCHTQNELNYHPLCYKTEPCVSCMYQNNPKLCPKCHSEEINRMTLLERGMATGNSENSPFHDSKLKSGQLFLDTFKVKPCMKKGNHNVKVCDYYHHDKDRRRPTSIFSYEPPMCMYVTRNMPCPNGDNCGYAHNKLEQLYHPERYKRKFCLHQPHNIHKCEYGDHCSFAHSEDEILIELLHTMKQDEYFYLNKYKTVFCPYIYEHDRNQCVYAHNPQDLRRDPNQYNYAAVQCFYWSQGQIYSYEEGGCPNQMNCPNCHGWKELEYHPVYYKTKPCNNGKKCPKKDCPFYHSPTERRQTQITSQLTKSLFPQKGSNSPGLMNQRMFTPEPSPPFIPENHRKMDLNYPHQPISAFMPFKMNQMAESESSRKMETKNNRLYGSLPAGTTYASSSEDEVFGNMSYKARTPAADFQFGAHNSFMSASNNSEKGKFEFGRSLFSQPLDLWGSFQQGHEEKLDDFFPNTNSTNVKINLPRSDSKTDNSSESESSGEKSSDLSNDRFKKSLIKNLDKKGLGHTKQYLIHPLIDLKALKSFTQKDFHLFPHISTEDKEKIVKIIQDILDEESLLSEVNTINEGESQPNQPSSFSDDGNLFKYLGSSDRSQGTMYSLTTQLERQSFY